METVRERLERELKYRESTVAQLRGKIARLQQQCPEVLNIKAPAIGLLVSTRGISITIFDKEREFPSLPVFLLSLTDEQKVDKKRYGENDDEMEYFSFRIAGIDIDLDRRMLKTRKCRRAIVQQETSFCGSVPDGVEVVEWLDDEEKKNG